MKSLAEFCRQWFPKSQSEVDTRWLVTSTQRVRHDVAHTLYLNRLWHAVPGRSCAGAIAGSADHHGADGSVAPGRLGTHSKYDQLLRGGTDGRKRRGAEAARPRAAPSMKWLRANAICSATLLPRTAGWNRCQTTSTGNMATNSRKASRSPVR